MEKENSSPPVGEGEVALLVGGLQATNAELHEANQRLLDAPKTERKAMKKGTAALEAKRDELAQRLKECRGASAEKVSEEKEIGKEEDEKEGEEGTGESEESEEEVEEAEDEYARMQYDPSLTYVQAEQCKIVFEMVSHLDPRPGGGFEEKALVT